MPRSLREQLRIPPDQRRAAFRWVWTILTATVAVVLVSAAALPPDRIAALAPVCERKRTTGRDCPLCGSTRAFLLISRGRFDEAGRQNRGSLPLYAGLFCNEGLFAVWLARGLRRRKKENSKC